MTEKNIDGEEDERSPPERRRKKKRRVAPVARSAQPLASASPARWTSGHLMVALALGLVTGGLVSYVVSDTGKPAAAAASDTAPAGSAGPRPGGPAAAPAAGADKFGRPAGDEHFGHDHPVQQQHGGPPAAPARSAPGPDGKDSFGRKAGDEHFGHTHP